MGGGWVGFVAGGRGQVTVIIAEYNFIEMLCSLRHAYASYLWKVLSSNLIFQLT